MKRNGSSIGGCAILAAALSVLIFACMSNRTPPSSPGLASDRAATTQAAEPDALHTAAADHDLIQLKRLLETGTLDVNARNAAGFTPLHVAFLSLGRVLGHPANPLMADIVAYLLAKGADPNLPFSFNAEPAYTVLHFAAFDGNMVLVPMLVAAHANPNAKDTRGFTPMHSAARCDFRLSCDDCSRAGSGDFSVRWKQGAKPVIAYLLAHGADLRAKTAIGQSVLEIFSTPCAADPEACQPAALQSDKPWPTGTCKQAYAFVHARMNP
jgi:Ankyrin repeats (3 copies)/Ankyrin repeats (many copies)